jgi:voltage-gated sodium channel
MYENVQARLKALIKNRVFEVLVITVIIISALEIGAKTYDLPPLVYQLFSVLDIAITLFFLFEISVRYIAHDDKRNFFKNGWNVFDTLVVVVSLIPIQDSEMALLGRLIRIFRVLRMVSFVPELRVLISSLLRALPPLSYVVLLMFIIFYIYGAVGSYLFAEINPDLWGDIAVAMLTLFRVMTFEDWTDVMYETMAVYASSWVFYLSFIFFTAFAFLNMVIGIVVRVMEDEHEKATREEQGEQPDLATLQAEIRELKALVAEKK